MEILYFLIPLSVVLVFCIGVAFWWFLRSGQFDDLEGPAYRILMDQDMSSNTSMDESPVETASKNDLGVKREGGKDGISGGAE